MTKFNQIKLNFIQKILERILKKEFSVYYGNRIEFVNPNLAKNYLRSALEAEEREVFSVIFMDNSHRVIAFEKLFYGLINRALVSPREVIKRALELNAAAIILSHNHPSGNSEPSLADKEITNRIKQATEIMDIRLLDHLIIGKGEVFSFLENGLLL